MTVESVVPKKVQKMAARKGVIQETLLLAHCVTHHRMYGTVCHLTVPLLPASVTYHFEIVLPIAYKGKER